MICRIFFIVILFSSVSQGFCQAFTQNTGLEVSPKFGFLIPHRATMQHLAKGHIAGIDLSIVNQTDGSKQWHEDFLLPKYGVSLYFSNLGYEEVLGNAFGARGFLALPFVKSKSWSFGSRLGAGLAYATKRFDQIINPKNNALGSRLNCFISLGVETEKQFKQSALTLGLDMSHMSNGAIRLPNLGLNIVFLSLGYTHYFEPIKKSETAHNVDTMGSEERWHFYVLGLYSSKQIYPTGGRNYNIFGITPYVQFRCTPKCIVEGGLDGIYNQSIYDKSGQVFPRSSNFQLGTYAAYVLPVSKMQLLVGMGAYLIDPADPGGPVYHRFGGRFKLGERLMGNLTIKAHWAKADYFEYGITYRIK
ncbi:MAG: acyloxyacyl hydrolase [Brumimicrobium sp.]|nr:acyloxyacyl hydrolase [Brumimicrobium sp.]